MTDEEAMAKDDALAAIIAKVREMPALEITVAGVKRLNTYISRESVVQLVQEYGFNDAVYLRKSKRRAVDAPSRTPQDGEG